MNLFAQITKVDEAKRLVFGRAAEEVVDKADEIMDYASSKPHFVKWSDDVAKDTDGKSLGNVRAMHGKVAAGKLTGIDFNDAAKAIDICAKVVDDGEWKKVLEGVYTGFSMGGSYVGEKKVEKADGRDVTRYTAKPSEISLVDRPCIPTAKFFEIQKADGTLAKVDFQAPAEPVAADAEDVTVNRTAEEVAALGKLMNANGLTLADLLEKAIPSFIAAKDAPAAEPVVADPVADLVIAKVDDAALDAEVGESLTKVEDALKDALVKVGARNSAADASRIKAIHDAAVSLGACCEPAEKVEPVAELAKLDAGALQKMVDDAVTAATAPLSKALDEAKTQITKLEAQPAPARVALRAISKAEDTGDAGLTKVDAPQPIVDDTGEAHEAAGLIKSMHRAGGRPLLAK